MIDNNQMKKIDLVFEHCIENCEKCPLRYLSDCTTAKKALIELDNVDNLNVMIIMK